MVYDANNFATRVMKSPSDLSLFHLNVRSLNNKFDEFTDYLNILGCQFDFICISESWLTHCNSHMFVLDNNELFSIVRNNPVNHIPSAE